MLSWCSPGAAGAGGALLVLVLVLSWCWCWCSPGALLVLVLVLVLLTNPGFCINGYLTLLPIYGILLGSSITPPT